MLIKTSYSCPLYLHKISAHRAAKSIYIREKSIRQSCVYCHREQRTWLFTFFHEIYKLAYRRDVMHVYNPYSIYTSAAVVALARAQVNLSLSLSLLARVQSPSSTSEMLTSRRREGEDNGEREVFDFFYCCWVDEREFFFWSFEFSWGGL